MALLCGWDYLSWNTFSVTRLLPHFSLVLVMFHTCMGQLVLMDFADNTTNATTPFSFPVMTETCGDAFNKYATIPFSAKENHEVGRLVDSDGGPGWGPFSIIGGNEKAHFRIDPEGKLRVIIPFFYPSEDEFNLRLASMNGNLVCTVKITIKLSGNLSLSEMIPLNHTLEDNMIFQSELPTLAPSTTTTTTSTTKTISLANFTTATTLMPNASHPLANIMSSSSTQKFANDDSFRIDENLTNKNTSKKQGAFFPGSGGGGVFPLGPRCTDPFMTVAVPSDTPVNTPITKVTATFELGIPIRYSTTDVVFDRFRVDPVTGVVYLGPEALTARNRPYGRIVPQTRSALEFRVRATIPNGQHCETVIRVNVIGNDNTIPPTPGRNPPVFTSQFLAFTVSNCEPGSVIGRVEAQGNSPGDHIQYVIDNPSSEVYIDLDSGLLRVGNMVPEPRVRQVVVRAIDSYGSSSTLPVTIDFQCRGSPSFPIGQLVFEQPVYQFLVNICNFGTPVGVVRLIGSPNGVEYSVTAWQEFSIDPNGLIQLRALQPNDNPERRFTVFAVDHYGNRGQVPVTVLLQCGNTLGPFPSNPQPFPPASLVDNRFPLGQPNQNLLGINPDLLFDPRGPANNQPPGSLGPSGPSQPGSFDQNLGPNPNGGFIAPPGSFPGPNSRFPSSFSPEVNNGLQGPQSGFMPGFGNPVNQPDFPPRNEFFPGPGFPAGPSFGSGPFPEQFMQFPNRDLTQNSLASQPGPSRVSQTFSFELPPLTDPATKQTNDHLNRLRPSRPFLLGDPSNLNHMEGIAAKSLNQSHIDIEDPNNARPVTVAPKQLQVNPTKQSSVTVSNDERLPMTVKTSFLFPARNTALFGSSQTFFQAPFSLFPPQTILPSRQLSLPGPQSLFPPPSMFGSPDRMSPLVQFNGGINRELGSNLFERQSFMGSFDQNSGLGPNSQMGMTNPSDVPQVPSRQIPFQGSSSSGLPEPVPGIDAIGQTSDDTVMMSPPGFNTPMVMLGPNGGMSFPGSLPGPSAMFPFDLPGRSIAGPPVMTQFPQFPQFPPPPHQLPPPLHQLQPPGPPLHQLQPPGPPLQQFAPPPFPIGSEPLFGPPFPDLGRMPDLTMRLPQTAGQTPPIFVMPLCAPPDTNFIGRVKAVAPDPLDRVTYFMYSSGGSDLFFIDSVTGEIRSRMALTIGTYAFDVAARDFAGRTAIMKLEVAITPSCLRPQMMDFLPDDSRFPSRALSSSRSLGMGPQFERHTYTFPIPSVLTSTTAIGQVKAFSDTGNIVRYNVSPSDDFRVDSEGNIFATRPVRKSRKLLVTAMDTTGRGASTTVNVTPSNVRPGFKPCAEDQISDDETVVANITHTFTKASQKTKPSVNINGPTVITVEAPLGGSFPPTLIARTILGEYIVTGGSGTYRWLNSDEVVFEITGEAVGILQTKTALVPGTYEYTAIVKDNAGAISSLVIKVVVKNPELSDNPKIQITTDSSLSWSRPVEMGPTAILD